MEETHPLDQPLRWGIAQRLEFIEFRLIWEGRINRSDIAARFGVTVQQASGDLGLYEQQAPENLNYDRNAKRFVPATTFRPRFLKPVADRQLLQLAAIGNGLLDPAETWFDALPPFSVVPVPQRSVATMTMRWMLEAIRTRSAIEIRYQSLNRPEDDCRVIAPHALAHNGVRWHARAWCPKNGEFRDFVLSRIHSTGSLHPCTVPASADREWFNEIDLILAPHPGLSEGAKRSLKEEYGMVRGRLRLPTRAALAFYLIQHLNLDLDLPPERKQLILENIDEVNAACADAKQAAKAALAQP